MTHSGSTAGFGGPTRTSRFALLGLIVSVLALLVLAGAALGYRLGWWHYGFALLTLTQYATFAAGLGAVISLIGVGRSWPGGVRRGFVTAIIGVVLGAGGFMLIFDQWMTVKTVPFIHDITTDFDNPPALVATVSAREAEESNPHVYAGPELAAKQRYGYPDIGPFMAHVDQADAFDRALAVAQSMGWEIVAAQRENGHIEATVTSPWYGFKDDIVVRVSAAGDGAEFGSRIDIRSISRQGRSDVGKNAERIRAYLSALEEAFG